MYYKKEGYEWNCYDTITQLLSDACEKYAERDAFVWKKGRHFVRKTYQDWKKDLLEMAGKIASLEVSHIGIVSDISYESVLCMYAALAAGKVVVPLEDDQIGIYYEEAVSSADIELILYGNDTLDRTETVCKWMSFQEVTQIEAKGFETWPQWESGRPACIFFTSGTTQCSREKTCVMLSQKNIATTCALFHSPFGSKTVPEMLMYLPIYHVLAFSGMVSCFAGGYKIFIGSGTKYFHIDLLTYCPDFILSVPLINELLKKGIEKEIQKSGKQKDVEKGIRLTKWFWKFGIDIRPKVFEEIYKGIGGRLRVLMVGGAFIDPEVITFFEDFGIYVLNGYGLTETTGVISQNTFYHTKKESVGIVLPYNEVKIVDGEILVRGDNVMLGYYKDEEKTRSIMEDGWLKTGDLGYLDAEGYLHITGRKRNLILLSNGVNVSPELLERELLQSSVVQEVLVREKDGRIHADIYAGEYEETQVKERKREIEEMLMQFNQNHPLHHRIVSWELRKQPFEKTATMKIKRKVQ